MGKCLVIIFVEGATDLEFYNKLVNQLHEYCPEKKFPAKIFPKDLKGIGNYKIHAERSFVKIKAKYSKEGYSEFIVALCYDTDVFETFQEKPPINWKDVEKKLIDKGATKVLQIKAKKSIEDWFLYDKVNILKYLKLSVKKTKIAKGSGAEILGKLFKQANKVYVKGLKVEGFVDKLDIKKIMGNICEDISPLCKVLGIECINENKKCK